MSGNMFIEMVCDSGPYKGHSLDCHIFTCEGCTSPAEYCDCGFDVSHKNDFEFSMRAKGLVPQIEPMHESNVKPMNVKRLLKVLELLRKIERNTKGDKNHQYVVEAITLLIGSQKTEPENEHDSRLRHGIS